MNVTEILQNIKSKLQTMEIYVILKEIYAENNICLKKHEIFANDKDVRV